MEDQVLFNRIDPSILENLSNSFKEAPTESSEETLEEVDSNLFNEFDAQFANPTLQSPYSDKSKIKQKLTDSQIKKYIEAKCWINGIYLNSLDTEYLVNCKKFASQRLYDKWYWKYFLNLVNEEILNRDVAIGPKRFYPGTENIPRRGGYKNYRYDSSKLF